MTNSVSKKFFPLNFQKRAKWGPSPDLLFTDGVFLLVLHRFKIGPGIYCVRNRFQNSCGFWPKPLAKAFDF